MFAWIKRKAQKLADRFKRNIVAKQAAIAIWAELKAKLPETPLKRTAVEAALRTAKAPRPPGLLVKPSIKARVSTWKVRVRVTDKKRRSSRAVAGEGWVTTDENGRRFYVTKSFKNGEARAPGCQPCDDDSKSAEEMS